MREEVSTAIFECGIGGEYDSTNIIVTPTVTGITSLGIDHTALLGDTIESIAWHKAGIMKPGIPCFSAPQPASAIVVLKSRAEEKGSPLTIVEEKNHIASVKLGLNGDFQRTNAALAIELSRAHLAALGQDVSPYPTIPAPFVRGLKTVHLPGRCDVRDDRKGAVKWYIDSAHTTESLALAAEWFASHFGPASSSSSTSPPPSSQSRLGRETRILLFNQQTRVPGPLLTAVYNTMLASLPAELLAMDGRGGGGAPFTHVIFCSNRTFSSKDVSAELKNLMQDEGKVDKLEVQKMLRGVWEGLEDGRGMGGRVGVEGGQESVEGGNDGVEVEGGRTDNKDGGDGKAAIQILPTIEDAINACRDIAAAALASSGDAEGEGEGVGTQDDEGGRVKVLVTGSMHLVGGVLEVLETEMETERNAAS